MHRGQYSCLHKGIKNEIDCDPVGTCLLLLLKHSINGMMKFAFPHAARLKRDYTIRA